MIEINLLFKVTIYLWIATVALITAGLFGPESWTEPSIKLPEGEYRYGPLIDYGHYIPFAAAVSTMASAVLAVFQKLMYLGLV